MIVSVVRCDRCKKLVDSPPPGEGVTAGYYSGWHNFTNTGEEHVCDSCMWSDARYIKVYGKQYDPAPDKVRLEALILEKKPNVR